MKRNCLDNIINSMIFLDKKIVNISMNNDLAGFSRRLNFNLLNLENYAELS